VTVGHVAVQAADRRLAGISQGVEDRCRGLQRELARAKLANLRDREERPPHDSDRHGTGGLAALRTGTGCAVPAPSRATGDEETCRGHAAVLPILAASDGNTKDAPACHPRWVRFRAQCVRRGRTRWAAIWSRIWMVVILAFSPGWSPRSRSDACSHTYLRGQLLEAARGDRHDPPHPGATRRSQSYSFSRPRRSCRSPPRSGSGLRCRCCCS
jgi:hypothetical protein